MSTFGLAEGFASWQWVNYLISKVPTGKKPLLINMDETQVVCSGGDVALVSGAKRSDSSSSSSSCRRIHKLSVTLPPPQK